MESLLLARDGIAPDAALFDQRAMTAHFGEPGRRLNATITLRSIARTGTIGMRPQWKM